MGDMSKLDQYFRQSTSLLKSRYERAAQIEHPLTKGTAREIFIRNFLEDIYPNKYIFGDGEIIDSQDGISNQADVVIYDEKFPVLEYGPSKHFLVEGVLAHIEVKSNLSGNLNDALSKSKSVKNLSIPVSPMDGPQPRDVIPDVWDMMTPGPVDMDHDELPEEYSVNHEKRMLHHTIDSWISRLEHNRMRHNMGEIPPQTYSAIFAYDGPKPSTFKENFMDYYDADTDEREIVDFVCVLDEYIMQKDSDDVIQFVKTDEDSLLWFFVSLAQAFIIHSMSRPVFSRYLPDREHPQF